MIGNRPCWAPDENGNGTGGRIDADSLLGELLVNRYRLEDVIAQGPFATVYRARDAEFDRDVALKLLEAAIDPEGEQARGMVSDVETAADVQHPSLVPVNEIGLHDGETIFVVEPFVAAETVAERLAEDGPFKPRVAMRIAREIFEGLSALHGSGLVHLNIKPENIFLVRDAMGAERAVLAGTAMHHVLALDQASQRDPSGCRARPEYISPEAVSGRPMDALSDIYLTGLLLYEMLCGRPAFSGTDFRKTARRHAIERPLSPRIVRRQAEISKSLDAVVMRCLEKTSTRRYSSAEEASAALQEVANSDDSSRNRTSLNFRPISSTMPQAADSEPEVAAQPTPEVDSAAEPEGADESVPNELLETSETIEALADTGALPNEGEDHPKEDESSDAETVEDETLDADTGDTNSGQGESEADNSDDGDDEVTDPEADTDDAVRSIHEPKIIVTDPQMRAMTQPLVSSEPTQPSQEAVDDANNQSIRLSSNHDGEVDRVPAHFRETGQWFVESVEELEAVNPHLAELEELGVPRDRNLFPWVIGILTILVVTVLAFWDEPEEPAWKARLRSAKQDVSAQNKAQAAKSVKASSKPAAATTAPKDSKSSDTAATNQNTPATIESLEASARASMAASTWDGVIDALKKMEALDPKSASLKVLRGDVTTQLFAKANAALKAGDPTTAQAMTEYSLAIVPDSVIARNLLKTVETTRQAQLAAEKKASAEAKTTAEETDAQKAAEVAAAQKAAEAAAAQTAAAEKAAAEKAAAQKAAELAAAQKAAAQKAAAQKAAAQKAAAQKAAAQTAAAQTAAAQKAAAQKAAAQKAAAQKAAAQKAAAQKAAARKAAAQKAAAQKAAARKAAAQKAAAQKAAAAKKPAGASAAQLVRDGQTHIKNARWNDASRAFKLALKKNGRLATAHSGLGKVAFQKGKFKEAVSHHSRSVKYASRNASFQVNLALAYFKTKGYAKAKKACEAALKLQPNNAKAKRYLKVINKKLGT